MDLTHEFTVPAGVEETWATLNDIGGVAECFPGAQVTSVEGDTFNGTVKVKLGPIALVYNGTGTFTEKDESARRMVVDAKGKDKRGNGTAGAHVTVTMSEESGSTRVKVVTDLNITGKPAQFGRGVIQDVSDKLLGQFTSCLETKVGSSGAEAAPADDPTPLATAVAGAVDPGAPEQAADGRVPDPKAPGGPAESRPRPHVVPPPASSSSGSDGDDALDLGATVLPILAKAYWKQIAGAVLALLVLRRLLGRR